MREPARGFAALLAATAALVILSRIGAAQEPEKPAHEPTLRESREILQSRNRDTMHPGDPLALSGVDQGDNDMRASTSILEHSDKNLLEVDQDEAYQRALAMYDSRAAFTTPITAVTPSGAAVAAKRVLPKAAGLPLESVNQWPWLVAIGISIAFMVWLGRHFAEQSPAAAAAAKRAGQGTRARA